MIKKIDTQLEKYDEKVGSSLNVIQTTPNGQIALADLKKALKVIKHRPADDVIEGLGKKLDVDSDGYVVCTGTTSFSALAYQLLIARIYLGT